MSFFLSSIRRSVCSTSTSTLAAAATAKAAKATTTLPFTHTVVSVRQYWKEVLRVRSYNPKKKNPIVLEDVERLAERSLRAQGSEGRYMYYLSLLLFFNNVSFVTSVRSFIRSFVHPFIHSKCIIIQNVLLIYTCTIRVHLYIFEYLSSQNKIKSLINNNL